MRIDQIVVGASPGDAVTESALRIRDALRRSVPSDLYGVHIHPSLEREVRRLFRDFPRTSEPGDIVIAHLSIGEPGLLDFICRSPERLVASYHNITPARFYEKVDPAFANRLREGRAELAVIAEHAVGAVAVSEYNATELRAAGFPAVEVAAPPINFHRLVGATRDPSLLETIPADAPLVLVIGQLLPHKRPDLAVDAHHLLNVNHDPNAHLVVAGTMRQHRYSSAVVRHVESLRLGTAHVTGEVSNSQLVSLLERADLLVVPSEHEGFGVPLLEAMSFGVPVVARDFGAISETAGGAALVLPADSGAAELCEATARVLADGALRTRMVEAGHARAAQFGESELTERWLAALARTLRATGGSAP